MKLSDEVLKLLVGGMGQESLEVGQNAVVGLLWRTGAVGAVWAKESFWRGEQRPPPAVFVTVLVGGIDEVLSNDEAGHLQAGNIAVELAAHFGAIETAGGTELAGNEAAMLTKNGEDGVVNGTLGRCRELAAAIVAEIWPPVAANETCFFVEELAVNAVAVSDNRTFPLP